MNNRQPFTAGGYHGGFDHPPPNTVANNEDSMRSSSSSNRILLSRSKSQPASMLGHQRQLQRHDSQLMITPKKRGYESPEGGSPKQLDSSIKHCDSPMLGAAVPGAVSVPGGILPQSGYSNEEKRKAFELHQDHHYHHHPRPESPPPSRVLLHQPSFSDPCSPPSMPRRHPTPPTPKYEDLYAPPPQAQPPKQPKRVASGPMIEIAPGAYARLRGAHETWSAVENDFYLPVVCFACSNQDLFCIQDASYVLCPVCRVVCPVEGMDAAHDGGVGLGFTLEDLCRWQSEILAKRNSRNSRSSSGR